MTQKIKLHNVYLALGSNIGDKHKNIDSAIQNINTSIGQIIAVSSLYETIPEDFNSENLFLNTTCHLQTNLSPVEVLEATKAIEIKLGRISKSANQIYTDRLIDIDILMYDDKVVEYPNLSIPHKHMHKRSFVLLPLVEIAPALIHPTFKETIAELLLKVK